MKTNERICFHSRKLRCIFRILLPKAPIAASAMRVLWKLISFLEGCNLVHIAMIDTTVVTIVSIGIGNAGDMDKRVRVLQQRGVPHYSAKGPAERTTARRTICPSKLSKGNKLKLSNRAVSSIESKLQRNLLLSRRNSIRRRSRKRKDLLIMEAAIRE